MEESKKLNGIVINQDKLDIVYGDVSSMPFDDESFDCISVFEPYIFGKTLKNVL